MNSVTCLHKYVLLLREGFGEKEKLHPDVLLLINICYFESKKNNDLLTLIHLLFNQLQFLKYIVHFSTKVYPVLQVYYVSNYNQYKILIQNFYTSVS